MTGQQTDRRAGNQDWFATDRKRTRHVSRAGAAENVTPNAMLGGIRRQTLTGDLPFLFTHYDDEAVRDEICARLAAHPLLDPDGVRVEVTEGVAALTGAVLTLRERELAEDITSGTRGVLRVRSELRVMRV